MTVEVPSVDDAKSETGAALPNMIEGAVTGAGIEIGGGAVPVIGEAAGGLLASFVLSNKGGKTYANRMAAFEATQRLVE